MTPRTDAMVTGNSDPGADEYEELANHARQLERELAEALLDTARLDRLDSLRLGYGRGWILRNSTTGRGMRLHETTDENAQKTVRKAIDSAVLERAK